MNSTIQRQFSHLYRDSIAVKPSSAHTGSYFGGNPPALQGFSWPTTCGRPLTFLACINCAELPLTSDLNWLPKNGSILFFYDTLEQPWGYDPNHKDGAYVKYVPEFDLEINANNIFLNEPISLLLPRKYITFELKKLPPSWGSPEFNKLTLTEDELSKYLEWRDSLQGRPPHHQLGGHPEQIQEGNMPEECKLVVAGVNTGASIDYNDKKVVSALGKSDDWQLLLQIDSDEVSWGDGGMLYFWVKKQDSERRDFSNTWTILQSH